MSTKQCYLIESQDIKLLQKKIREIIESSGYKEEQTTYYDLEESTLNAVLEDLDTYSFLTPRKVVIISNALFLMASEIKFEEKEISSLLKYLRNPAPDVLFIMGVEKCDERKKIGKEIKQLVEFCKVEMSPEAVLKEELTEYKIKKDAQNLLLEYVEKDISKLENECEKPKISNTDKLAFDFVKYIALRDKKKIFEQYEVLKENHFEAHSMIGLIESQMKLIYQVLLGKRKNMTKENLAKLLKEHPYRIQKTLEFLPFYSEKDLQTFIHKLHELDYKIKSGQIDATLGFEIFLISI